MKISGVNFSYNNYFIPPKNHKQQFCGGYKDISSEYKREEFDKKLDLFIKNYRNAFSFYIPEVKEVEINGKKAKLEIYKNKYYVLTSKEGSIKALMKIADNEHNYECSDDFYSKNIGFAEICLLYSKGHGAGEFLIKEAVRKSVDMGYKGRVGLFACNINNVTGSPIPFYRKMGFKAANQYKENQIEEAMEKMKIAGAYRGPDEAHMYLPYEKIKEYLS